jgi:tetratricopeptide (TPR) repeat protein
MQRHPFNTKTIIEMGCSMKKKADNFSLVAFLLFFLVSACSPYMRGDIQMSLQNYDAAIPLLEEALAQDPGNLAARKRLGYAYLKEKQPNQAIQQFEEVLRREPGDPEGTYYLGMAYLESGKRAEAIDTWRDYNNPGNSEVEKEIKKQLTLLEISESIYLAKEALAEEQKLATLPPESDTVAVFYFKDISPDQRYRYLQKAMATLIITDLAKVESLQVLERTRVQFLLTEMQMGETGIVEAETAPRVGHLLGAENLIVGTMQAGSLEVGGSVASTSQESVSGAFSVKGPEEEFYVVEKGVVYNILQVLQVPYTETEKLAIDPYQTKNLQAVLYFGQGLDALDLGEWQTAKDFFYKAYKEDPEFELARQFGDGTPAATAPSISSISTMSIAEMAAVVDASVSSAAAAAAASAASSGVGGGAAPAAQGTGGVSVSW